MSFEIIDRVLDKGEATNAQTAQFEGLLRNLRGGNDIVNRWRLRYPKNRLFTFFAGKARYAVSRIDRIYIREN